MNNNNERRDPLSEGSLIDIANLFIKPLLKFKPSHKDMSVFLAEEIFHTDERFIRRYTVRTEFQIPGLYKAADNVAYQGLGYRTMAAGTELWVRTDDTMPDTIDVETYVGPGQSEHWYQLTSVQWRSIQSNLMRDLRTRL